MVKVGIIGVGGWISDQHLRAYSKISGVKTLAICDLNKENLKTFSQKYNIPYTFEDYHQMLESEELNAVSVVLPTYLHCSVTIEALEKGKDVLVEKPMAINSQEAEQMAQKAKEKKKVLMVGMCRRFLPEFQFLKNLVEKGELGGIYYIKTRLFRRKTFPHGFSTWFKEESKSGGGVLIDTGVHMLDLSLWLADNFNATSVCGTTYNKFGDNVEDMATALVRLDNGTAVSLEVAWELFRESKTEYFLELFGTKGSAKVQPLETPLLKIYKEIEGRDVEIAPQFPSEIGIADGEIAHFIECIRKRKEPSSTPEQAIKTMGILEAIYQSAKSGGGWTNVEEREEGC